ncbi:hypothetical protein FSP39_006347 [Pinctada imbricata]|uniref:GPI alpha-1,4-mannosyltransferase I, catalytic subunit n=1 Tax=Pinctada imbricata TaxID=66713 RepID=A0AA88XHE4_PINIB|nr:hypothetical protein FSP39_006347 [Pinctada imbricata]
MLQPNITLNPAFGKLLFIVFDIISGYLTYAMLIRQGTTKSRALLSASFWLLNPLPIGVSGRGNAESFLSLLVLLTFKFHIERKPILSAILYGLAVHIKIYPVIYALPLYLNIDSKTDNGRRSLRDRLLPTVNRVRYFIVAAAVFIALTSYYYYFYGWDFLENTYLYHVTRKDTKHNFSVYFYLLYLTANSWYSDMIGRAAFIPQAVLVLIFSHRYYTDLPFCWFLSTLAFVTFNKVCTSQYFLWYLTFLPLILPSLSMSTRKAVLLIMLWVIGQAVWGIPASLLEFEGMDTYFFIWIASIMFCLINVYILCSVINSYIYTPWKYDALSKSS